jgi:hypothetical protein
MPSIETGTAGPETNSYRVLHDEAVRPIKAQRSSVDELRTRAGVLISAAAIVTGFLGPNALESGQNGLISLIASLLLVLVILPLIAVLLPTSGWISPMHESREVRSNLETSRLRWQ